VKRIVSIATTGNRKEQLKNTVQSLINQVDTIFIYDNSKNKDLTDNAKFQPLINLKEDCYFFTCDDDLIYPKDYIKQMAKGIDKHKTIVTAHGRVLKQGRNKYYKTDHDEYSFQHQIQNPIQLDVAGTGCTGFRTDYFKPIIHNSRYKCMSDLVFSLEAIKNGKTITLIPHKRDWIKGQEVSSSIFKKYANSPQKEQIELMNEILRWKD
jgi:hypothetical protein